jgi:hypothetical protein
MKKLFFFGSFISFAIGPKTGESLSSIKKSIGRTLARFFGFDLTMNGGIEK